MFPLAPWRRDALRTNLWFVPMLEVARRGRPVLHHARARQRGCTRHELTLPVWMVFGSADAARTILTALAAAVITVVGIVFSITIVTLTLASTQFGPRMLRNFIRDRGTQYTLGTFVATFVYATLVLISIGPGQPAGPAPVDHGLGRARDGLDGRADLLHPPHRDVDPAAERDRQHRRRPVARDRRRVAPGRRARSRPDRRSPSC